MSELPVETTSTPPTSAAPRRGGAFYSLRDQLAFLITAMVSFAGYLYTVAPSVTLEDSGEFLTAANHLGVPHPPGYPIWTILAWIWKSILPFGNIAWRINVMSAFFAAIAIGLCALLISKSGHVIACKVEFMRHVIFKPLRDLIVLASSVSASLMLAFSPVMWSQAVITEVYALNAFFLMVTLVLLYRWRFEPERRWRLYLSAFMWGVGLTSHQTQVLLVVAFPTYILLVDRKFGRDVLLPILSVILFSTLVSPDWIEKLFHNRIVPGLSLLLAVMRLVPNIWAMFKQPSQPFTGVCGLLVAVATGWWLYRLVNEGPGRMTTWPRVLALYGAVVLGLMFYAYMPLASATNPPMNWGYTRLPEGFVHQFTRGQYEKLHTERTVLQFWGQINMFFDDLKSQFNIAYALIALAALFFFRDMAEDDRKWMKFLLSAFLFLSVGFIFLSNPTFEKQKQFTDRVFFLPGHCVYALWIGYGLILGLGYLFQQMQGARAAAPALAAVVALLPVVSIYLNWADQEERDHDFGYRFGYLMFKPGGGYPEMDQNAVLFGGTDPGRFVPTYMIFVESQVPPRAKTHMAKFPDSGTFDRSDVYIITQNALADSTYMNYIRDHYDYGRPDASKPETLQNRSWWQRTLYLWAQKPLGRDRAYPKEPIWIPSEKDAQQAFQMYVQDFQTRPPMPGEDVRVEGGRVSVQGVQGVMAINGYLTKMIFDKNKDKHSFYVEESYAIPWMYPYLEPYGIILKLNRDPLPQFTPEMVARDRAYWDALTDDILNDPKFHRDDVAQKTYSKLRSAIGGLYAFRRMAAEAEYAYKQAIKLCPDSPEANFRLAQLYVERGRFDDALAILDVYQKRDPLNIKIAEAINAIKEMQKQTTETQTLQQQFAANPGDVQAGMALVAAYARRQQFDAMDATVNTLLARPEFGSNEFLAVAQGYAQLKRADRLTDLLTIFTQRYPQNPVGWYNLALVFSARGNCDGAAEVLQRALVLDRAGRILNIAQKDERLNNCRKNSRLQMLLTARATAPPSEFTITH